VKRRTFVAALSALLAAGTAHAAWDKGAAVTLPALTLLDGTPLDTAALKGKVVVLEFWASWCPFCAKQNPLIEALHRDNRARGLEVVAVSIDKTAKAAQDYIKAHRYTFRAGMVNPAYEAIYKLRKGLPQTYVIGRDGRIAQLDMGEMFEEDIQAIKRHL
jgi:thiol-disulfide isomerase/thioredoxin